jgi:hypothetical protein
MDDFYVTKKSNNQVTIHGKNRGSTLLWKDRKKHRLCDAPKGLIKDDSSIIPMIINLTRYAKEVEISIDGKCGQEKEYLQGNKVMVTGGRAKFPKFSFLKSSFNENENSNKHESWILIFKIYGEEGEVINILTSSPIVVFSIRGQIKDEDFVITSLIPAQGEINRDHQVALFGNFKFDESLIVLVLRKKIIFKNKILNYLFLQYFS